MKNAKRYPIPLGYRNWYKKTTSIAGGFLIPKI